MVLNWFDITTPEGYFSIKDLLKDITRSPEAAAFVNPLLAEMTASRMKKAEQKEQEAGRKTQKSGEGISVEARRNITLQFSLLQLIRMGAPDLTRERIIEINQKLNQIPKK